MGRNVTTDMIKRCYLSDQEPTRDANATKQFTVNPNVMSKNNNNNV